jgi:hypothetical protein
MSKAKNLTVQYIEGYTGIPRFDFETEEEIECFNQIEIEAKEKEFVIILYYDKFQYELVKKIINK